jgi:hypothetical protein
MSVAGPGIVLFLRQFKFIIASPYMALKLTQDLKTVESSNDRLRLHNKELADANVALRQEIQGIRLQLGQLADSSCDGSASIRKRRPVRPSRPNASSNDNDP